MPWRARLKTSLPPFVSEASIKMSWNRLSHSVVFHLVFELALPASCHRFISFVPARPGQKGVWAQHELASAGYLQSPAICQRGTNQHFTRSPPRGNRLWRRQKGDVVWWRNGMHEKKGRRDKRDRNRGAEWGKESRKAASSLLIPNLPRCSGPPVVFNSCSVERSVPLLSPENMRTHTNVHVYMKSNRDRYSTFIFCILGKIYLRERCQRKS